ncbi:MAG: ABC transporter permease [Opitutae bacterium]|nr:ABC transporter permease [Opitutae bacterium]
MDPATMANPCDHKPRDGGAHHQPASHHQPDAAPHHNPVESAVSPWRRSRERFFANRGGVAAGLFVLAIFVLCAAAPLIAPFPFEAQDLSLGPAAPSWEHWLGTDVLGRDVLSRLLYGGQISLKIGIVATAVSCVIGVFYGLVAGYFGGVADSAMMRIVDILYALPFTLFVILLTVVFGQDLWLIYVAIGAISWLTMARIVRSRAQELRTQPFIEAAICMGQTAPKILLRHLFPNVLGTVIVYATLTVPGIMLLEAFISFLGLGVKPPMTSWGLMIKEGTDAMADYPWLLIAPGAAFAGTLFALNVFGDALRDAFDPKKS